ncbi:MAG: hypothetical protein GY820_08200 [Gammaproteobacteria bacterium]|nr:hypothetical protein [Gammaproteobacteria bacterium]
MIELTSPAEENMESWRVTKRTKYEKLGDNIRDSGEWTVHVFTIEVGARGFIGKSVLASGMRLGLDYKTSSSMVRELSRLAIRCSHFIWINRNNTGWESPEMGT